MLAVVDSEKPKQEVTRWLYYVECHNTVFGSKRSAIYAQAVYFLHSTMRVMCLRLSDISVICRVTYLQFPMQACFSFTSASQAAQGRIWFTQYQTSDVA